MWLDISPKHLQLKGKRLDCKYWLNTLSRYQSIRKRLPRKADKVTAADLFLLLYGWDPSIREDPPDKALAAWLERELGSDRIAELRRTTMGNAEKSAYGAIKLFQELMRLNRSTFKTIVETAHHHDTIDALADQAPDAAAHALTEYEKVKVSLAENIQAGEDSDEEGQHVANAVATVMQDIDAIGELSAIMQSGSQGGGSLGGSKSFSLGGAGERLIDLGLDEELMRTLRGQDEFRKILAAAGRLRILAGEIKSRKPRPLPTPVGITMGGDLSKLVPSEWALASDPDLEDLFYQRLIEHGLMIYKPQLRVIEGKGPIVVLLDVSGSMWGANERNAKAMFLQLTRSANEQHRSIAYVPFASYAGDPLFIRETRDLIHIITPQRYNNLGGGTDFDNAFNKAMDVVRDSGNYRKADILMLTDGYSRLSTEVEKRIDEVSTEGTRFMGVLFDGEWPENVSSRLDLHIKCDREGSLSWASDVLEKLV